MSLYVRVRTAKPRGATRHHNTYSQGRKIYKARNHKHQEFQTKNTKGQTVTLCSIPRCKYKEVKKDA